MSGDSLEAVQGATKTLYEAFPTNLYEASFALATRFYGDEPEKQNHTLIHSLATYIQIMRILSQQAVALLFRDNATVDLLQKEKLDLIQSVSTPNLI